MPKLIHYRNKCIGCGICQQMQPELWRMSKKDGKAVLLQAVEKKGVQQLTIHTSMEQQSRLVIEACPARVIKIC